MLTDFQTAKIPNLFNMFDSDSSGTMEQSDIVRIIDGCAAQRGWANTSPEYLEFYDTFYGLWIGMTTLADKNQDDVIQLNEFLNFFDGIMQAPDNYNMVVNGISNAVFSTFDIDDDGKLSLAEYMGFYQTIGLKTDLAKSVYGKLDLNSDGSITVDELTQLVDQFFTSQDPNAPGNEFFGPVA